MEKTIIKQDKVALAYYRGYKGTLQNAIQQAVDKFLAMDIGGVDSRDLVSLIREPKQFYDERIDSLVNVPEVSIGGFKRLKSATLKELELPNPSQFVAAANSASQIHGGGVTVYDFIIDGRFVDIKPEVDKARVDMYTVYADGDAGKTFALLNAIAQSLNDFNKHMKEVYGRSIITHSYNGSTVNVDQYFTSTRKSNTVSVNSNNLPRKRRNVH